MPAVFRHAVGQALRSVRCCDTALLVR